MLWLVGESPFDDMLNEGSEGAAQQGEGGDLPHQTVTPPPPQFPALSMRTLESCRPQALRILLKLHCCIEVSEGRWAPAPNFGANCS